MGQWINRLIGHLTDMAKALKPHVEAVLGWVGEHRRTIARCKNTAGNIGW